MSVSSPSSGGVRVAIARDPALVRTVRLVAAAVARRHECPEQLIEEIRLAVGEACAVMIGVEATAQSPDEQIVIGIGTDEGTVSVMVTGRVAVEEDSEFAEIGIDPWALLRGLSEDMSVTETDGQATVKLSWPR